MSTILETNIALKKEDNIQKPLIVITMATSRQGTALIEYLSKEGKYKIRAITRNSETSKANYLKTFKDLEVVEGNLLDKESLKKAFEGAYGIYGNTTPTLGWKLFRGSMCQEYELKQGRNLIDAVLETTDSGNLKHFIFSSICKAKDPLNKVRIPSHFSNKWNIEEYLQNKGLKSISTILRPVSYFENFNTNIPNIKISENSFPGILDPDKPWQLIAIEDIGQWANAAFKYKNIFIGKELNIAGEELTGKQMATILEGIKLKDNSKPVKYQKIPRLIISLLEHDIGIMANWIEKNGYGANLLNIQKLANEVNVNITSLSNWLKK